MSYRQAPAGLPVSAVTPNEAMYIHGLPQNVPFQPPLDLNPQIQQFAPIITGVFLAELQNNASKNASRTFLFNILSQNSYQNNEFLDALQAAVDYSEFLMATQGVPPEQAITKACAEVASIMASVQVRKYPQLETMLPQGGMQSVEQWLNHFNQMQQAIVQYKQQASQVQQGGNWARPQPQQQGGPFGGGWGGQQQPQQANWSPQPQQNWNQQQSWPGNQGNWGPQPQQNNWAAQQHQNMSTMGGGHRSGIVGARASHPAQMSAGNGRQHGGADMFQQGPSGRAQPQNQSKQFTGSLKPNANRAVVDDMDNYGNAPQPQASQGFPEWPAKHTAQGNVAPAPVAPQPEPEQNRPLDYLRNGEEELMPAHLSDWEKTFSFEQPYRIAFDPAKEIKFLKRTRDGSVQECLEPYGEHMDYLRHEMNPSFAQKTRLEEHEARVVPNWEMVSDMKRLPDVAEDGSEIVVDGEPDVDPGKDPLVLPDILYAHSLSQAKFQHEICLMERGIEQKSEDLPYEFYHNHVTPYLNSGDKGVNLQEILLILKQADSLGRFIEQLAELHGHIPNDCWYMIHDRATDKINEALSTNIQLGDWKIDSIVDDWDELHEAFLEEFGPEKGNGLFATLEVKGFDDILSASINVLAGESLDEYLATMPEALTSEHPEFKERLVAITEACSVTHVPWNAADISMVLDDEGGAVLESRLPGLYKAIQGIVKRTKRTTLKFRHRYIITNDNIMLEIHTGYMGKDFYILKEA